MKKINLRKMFLALADVFIIVVSGILANYILLLVGYIGAASSKGLLSYIVIDLVMCLFTLYISGTYSKLWRYFNAKDYIVCGTAVFSGFTLGFVISLFLQIPQRKIFCIVHFAIALVGILAFRFVFRRTFLDLTEAGRAEGGERTLIVGAGNAGRMIVREIHNAKEQGDVNNPSKSIIPVCFVDDDLKKLNQKIEGIPVVGTCPEIVKICDEYRIDNIIVAVPSCEEDEKRKILDYCSATECKIKIIPYLGELLFDDGHTQLISQAKEIKIEDLLGRKPIEFDRKEIHDLINGKVCLVTGGGGSIGSELVRQIAKNDPKQIIIVDIYENNAYDIQQELVLEYGTKLNLVTLISSVRDYDKMELIFKTYRPELVFHAAAHKHVPLMETVPEEAVKNNIFGTFNVATLAEKYKAKKFVMISTDKAVNPTNVMGCSKRICEIYVQSLDKAIKDGKVNGHTEFITTRFGNVLGSNGSVIPLFKEQIKNGGPVTVTDPNIVRFFMLIPEACKLVLEAGTKGHGGEIFVFDMGKAVKIVDLARRMIQLSGVDIDIKFTGLRDGEKLYEEVLNSKETTLPAFHPKIKIAKVRMYDYVSVCKSIEELVEHSYENDDMQIVKIMKNIVPEFKSQHSKYEVLDLC